MRKVTSVFKEKLKDKNRHLLYWANISLTDGTQLTLSNEDLMQGDGFKITDATSGTNSFDIGAVISNELTLKINNMNDQYSTYDFQGASVVAFIGMEMIKNMFEKVIVGTYIVDESQAAGFMIILRCLDNVRKLDQPYSKSTLQYPATLLQIARDACETCGLSLNNKNFDGSEYVVQERPDGEATTCREILSWVAQITCKYVRCDAQGRVELKWYDEPGSLEEYALADDRENKILASTEDEIIVFSLPDTDPGRADGGRFDTSKPYSTGDPLDGGYFNPWDTTGAEYDAGKFESMKTYHHIVSMQSLTVGTDDIVITGVSVSLDDVEGNNKQYLYGDIGYVLMIEKNGLIQEEQQAKEVAVSIGKKLKGLAFRTFSASHVSDPTIEAGDTVYVTDRKQNSYRSYITNTTFTAGGIQKSSCGAETPSQKNTVKFTEATKTLVAAKKNTAEQINTYDKSVQALSSLITQSFGVYKTEEKLEDGSTIYYMHNKPVLEESDTIWKMTADAFAVSTDGGKTWNAGMDSQGNAVVNVLSAIGIRFDWAKGGTLTLGGDSNMNGVLQVLDAEGKVICELNKDGADVVGKVVTRNDRNGFSASLEDGKLVLYDANGNTNCTIQMLGITNDMGQTWHWAPRIVGHGNNQVELVLDGVDGQIDFRTSKLLMDGTEARTGKAEFSDGSYLTFEKGILTGGKTANGTEF